MIEMINSMPSLLSYVIIAFTLLVHTLLLSTRKHASISLIIPLLWIALSVILLSQGNHLNVLSSIIVLIGLLAFSALGRGIRKSRIHRQDSQIDLRSYK